MKFPFNIEKRGNHIQQLIINLILEIFGFNQGQQQTREIHLNWNNSARKGKIAVIKPGKLTPSVRLTPELNGLDFQLYIFPPRIDREYRQNLLTEYNLKDRRLFFWFPAKLNYNSFEIIKKYFKDKQNLRKQQALTILKNIYKQGRIENIADRYRNFNTDNFEKIIAQIVRDQLTVIYSSHPVLETDWQEISLNYLQEQYQKQGLIQKFIKIIDDTGQHSLKKELYPFFRKSPFGLTAEHFKLLLLAVYQLGVCRLLNEEGKLISLKNNTISEFYNRYPDFAYVTRGELISYHNWRQYLKIIECFEEELPGRELNLRQQHELWRLIIIIQKQYLKEIQDAIKQNTSLCYQLDQKQQIQKINHPLFILHHLFDQRHYQTKNSYDGLTITLKLWSRVYGDLDTFRQQLDRVNSILTFFQDQQHCQLIRHYNYLKNISLPIKGYQQLRLNLLTVLKKYHQLLPVITYSQYYREMMDNITSFKNKYIEQYYREHRCYQEKINSFRENLRQSPTYQTLKLLDGIQAINSVKKNDYIRGFFPEVCQNQDIKGALQVHPKCSCGFTLGDELLIPSINKVTPMLTRGIKEYMEKLLENNRYKKRLNRYCQQQQHPGPLNRVLQHKPGDFAEEANMELITPEVIASINRALGHTREINIPLNNLTEIMEGSYSAENLTSIINNLETALEQIVRKEIKKKRTSDPEEIIVNLIK